MSCDMIFVKDEDNSEKLETTSSLFERTEGNSDYGEPFVGLRLLLDFTPNEDIDNEFIQTKCCEFWDFINSQPEFEMKAVTSFESFSKKVESKENIVKQKCYTLNVNEKTAVSMLKFAEDKGLINRAFESKLPTLQYCNEELKDYINKTSLTEMSEHRSIGRKKKSKDKSQDISLTAVNEMCRKLESWDYVHPKSMDPPGAVPTLETSLKHHNICRN